MGSAIQVFAGNKAAPDFARSIRLRCCAAGADYAESPYLLFWAAALSAASLANHNALNRAVFPERPELPPRVTRTLSFHERSSQAGIPIGFLLNR
jgi:hypothetical protein